MGAGSAWLGQGSSTAESSSARRGGPLRVVWPVGVGGSEREGKSILSLYSSGPGV